jgi:predicted RNA methylase
VSQVGFAVHVIDCGCKVEPFAHPRATVVAVPPFGNRAFSFEQSPA